MKNRKVIESSSVVVTADSEVSVDSAVEDSNDVAVVEED